MALKLIAKGYNVTVMDTLSKQIHGENPEETSPLYLSIKGSVTSREDWMKALKGQETVIHLVAETGTGLSMYEIEKYVETNIGGTALLLDILTNTKYNVKRMLVVELRAIYAEGKYHCEKCGDVYPLDRKDEDMAKGDFECHCPGCEVK